jgi:hypothetical protein
MIERKRRGLSAEQKAELWKRWKAGQSLNEIGRALGKDHVVVHFVLARHGGIAPPTRRRSRRVLTLAECEDISRGIASGCAMRVTLCGNLPATWEARNAGTVRLATARNIIPSCKADLALAGTNGGARAQTIAEKVKTVSELRPSRINH